VPACHTCSGHAVVSHAVRACNDCFLEHVAWDSTKTYDVFGPEGGKAVVLVHGALVGRHCMVLEARALADAGYRCDDD
jgi:hypothetical protein